MNKRKLTIIGIIVLMLIVSFVGMKVLKGMKKEPEKKVATKQKRYVKAEKVKYANIKSEVVASGRVASAQYIDLSAEVQGKILNGNIPLKKGQNFKAGDLLAKIYNQEASYNLQGRKSRFLTQIANLLADFKIDYPNSYNEWNAFFESINIMQDLPELPKPKSKQEKVFLATRNILSDFYAIKSEEIRLKKYNIYAPFNGTFTDVFLEVGSVANPGSKLAKIIRTDQLELEVPIDITNSKWIKTGNKVKVQSEDGSMEWQGILVRKSSFVNPQTQSFSAFVKILPNSTYPIYKGQYMKAFFPGMEIKQAMEIPRNAVFNHNEVFIVKNGRLEKKEISIQKINQETLIFNGLEENSELVIEALINAAENTEVEIIR